MAPSPHSTPGVIQWETMNNTDHLQAFYIQWDTNPLVAVPGIDHTWTAAAILSIKHELPTAYVTSCISLLCSKQFSLQISVQFTFSDLITFTKFLPACPPTQVPSLHNAIQKYHIFTSKFPSCTPNMNRGSFLKSQHHPLEFAIRIQFQHFIINST